MAITTKKKFELTQTEYDALKAELDKLVHVDKEKNIEDLALARSQGDLKENADYDAARDAQSRINGRIEEIKNILNNTVIVASASNGNVIAIGSTVTFVSKATGSEATVIIKGNMGADPLAEIPAISNECPLGKALIGHSAGETVTVAAENPYEVEIVSLAR